MLQQWPLVTSTPEQGRVGINCTAHIFPPFSWSSSISPMLRGWANPIHSLLHHLSGEPARGRPALPLLFALAHHQLHAAGRCWEFILQNLEATGEPQNLPELPPLLSFWSNQPSQARLGAEAASGWPPCQACREHKGDRHPSKTHPLLKKHIPAADAICLAGCEAWKSHPALELYRRQEKKLHFRFQKSIFPFSVWWSTWIQNYASEIWSTNTAVRRRLHLLGEWVTKEQKSDSSHAPQPQMEKQGKKIIKNQWAEKPSGRKGWGVWSWADTGVTPHTEVHRSTSARCSRVQRI